MAYTEIYVHQVVGVPGSDVGHLPRWDGHDHTLCGGAAIEAAIERIDEANHVVQLNPARRPYAEVVAELVSWWFEPDGRRPCRDCVRKADAEHQRRLDQIRAMGGRP